MCVQVKNLFKARVRQHQIPIQYCEMAEPYLKSLQNPDTPVTDPPPPPPPAIGIFISNMTELSEDVLKYGRGCQWVSSALVARAHKIWRSLGSKTSRRDAHQQIELATAS